MPSDLTFAIGPLRRGDLTAVVRIDAELTGRPKLAYWKSAFKRFVSDTSSRMLVGLAARDGKKLVGYLLGEIRAFEFGSAPCGWIFAVGVDPQYGHHGIGSALVSEAARRLGRDGVSTVRTMVGRNDVSMLAFFRSNGFVGGSFTQLELELPSQRAVPPRKGR